MKKLIVLLTAILISVSLVRADVPAVVQKEFEKKYPGAEKLKWSQQKNGQCDATFKWNDKKCTASFSETGEWLQTETVLSYKELPLQVKKAINAKYIVGSIKGASKTESPQGIRYGVEFKYGYKPGWAHYAEDGTEL
jgi:hypothetical protein